MEHLQIQDSDLQKTVQQFQCLMRVASEQIEQAYGVEIHALQQQLNQLGGDLICVKALNETCFGVMISDGMGKGLSASLSVFRLHQFFHTIDIIPKSPHKALDALNDYLCRYSPKGTFVTALVAVFDIRENLIHYAAANMPDPCVFQGSPLTQITGSGKGLPLGLLKTEKYHTRQLEFPEESVVFLSTDGFQGPTPNILAADLMSENPSDLLTILNAEQTAPLKDDYAFLSICRKSANKPAGLAQGEFPQAITSPSPQINSHVFIVDDEEDIRELISFKLERNGYVTSEFETGEALLEKLGTVTQMPDAIVLDKRMPGLDGFEVLKQLKQNPKYCDIPVVMLTGANSPEDIAEGISAGAYYYLAKPIDFAVMLASIGEAIRDGIRNKELRQSLQTNTFALNHIETATFTISDFEEASSLSSTLAQLSSNPKIVVVGLMELLINSIEHGNLNFSYDDKTKMLLEGTYRENIKARQKSPEYADLKVTLEVQKQPSQWQVTIKDCGNGFNWEPYLDFSPERMTHTHGRGIALSRKLSFNKVEYQGNGNTVIVSFNRCNIGT